MKDHLLTWEAVPLFANPTDPVADDESDAACWPNLGNWIPVSFLLVEMFLQTLTGRTGCFDWLRLCSAELQQPGLPLRGLPSFSASELGTRSRWPSPQVKWLEKNAPCFEDQNAPWVF